MKDIREALNEAEEKFNKNRKIIFGSYVNLDNMLQQYKSCDIYTIEKPPRKISRRLYDSPFIEMIALPPYVASANKLLQQNSYESFFESTMNDIFQLNNLSYFSKNTSYLTDTSNLKSTSHLTNDKSDSELQQQLLFTLGYFASLATVDFDKLINTLSSKIIISSEKNDEYGVRNILGSILGKLGCSIYYYDSGNLSNVAFNSEYKNWTDECINLVFGKLKLMFPKVEIDDPLEIIMDHMGLIKFRMDNIVLIDQVNNGHYIPTVFNEKEEDMNLPLVERLGRILISRQAISSKYVQTIIEVSAALIRTLQK